MKRTALLLVPVLAGLALYSPRSHSDVPTPDTSAMDPRDPELSELTEQVSERDLNDLARDSNTEIPSTETYEALSACEKQNELWSRVKATAHRELPKFDKMGLWQMLRLAFQRKAPKAHTPIDFAPKGWKKLLHRRGAMAKIRIVPRENRYTGVFQGAECALLRLSLTFRPDGKQAVAPGLALKILRDGVVSANVSALVSLDGQGKEYNFFKNALSNIVPISQNFGAKLVHKIFRRLSPYPEELLAEDLARVDSQGIPAGTVVAPRQIFFVPSSELVFPSSAHDVRADFLKIPAGTTIYQVRAVNASHAEYDYSNYTAETVAQFLTDSEPVADIVTTSEFVASQFGDEGIFFKHQIRP